MFYKLLGMAVWNGAKFFLRRKYGSTYAPKPLLAGLTARQPPRGLGPFAGYGRVVRDPAPAGPRDRGRRVAPVGGRQRPRARARALDVLGGRPARASGAAAARRGVRPPLRVAARRPLRA